MGGAIVLKIAAQYQTELQGIIGSKAFAPGRYNDYLHHPQFTGRAAASTRTACARPKAGGEQAGKLVVLQPVGPRRIRRRRAFLTASTGTGARISSD